MPGGLGHADLADKLVTTMVPRQLLGGARIERVMELCAWRAGELGEGIVRLMGGEVGGRRSRNDE